MPLPFHAHANDGGVAEIHLCRTLWLHFPADLQKVGISGEGRALMIFDILAGAPLGVATFGD